MNKKVSTLPVYYTIIPNHLWQEADLFISYLTFSLFEPPTQCAHCESKSFRLYQERKKPRWFCNDCHKTFNQHTNTPFANTQNLEEFGKLANWYLSGLSSYQIAQKTRHTIQTIRRKEKIFLWLMQMNYPMLYEWWITHHLYQKRETTLSVAQQQKQFMDWLHELLNPSEQKPCPGCGKKLNCHLPKGVPTLYCRNCKTTYRLIGQTELCKMKYYHLWPDYAKLLIKGATDRDISQALNISPHLCCTWRSKFLSQMNKLNLHDLIFWINWQRNRNRITNITKLVRKRLRKKI